MIWSYPHPPWTPHTCALSYLTNSLEPSQKFAIKRGSLVPFCKLIFGIESELPYALGTHTLMLEFHTNLMLHQAYAIEALHSFIENKHSHA